MAKRTVSFEDYSEPTWEEYTGEDPPPNRWFTGVCRRALYREDDDAMLFIVEISDPDSPYNGWGKGFFAPFEGDRKFLIQEMVRALQGGSKKAVSIDWENEKAVETWLKKTKPFKFKTREYNDNIQVRMVRPLMEDVSSSKPGSKPVPAPAPEPDEDDTLEDYTEEELSEKDVEELQAILGEEFEVDVPKKLRRQTQDDYVQTLIEAILDAQDKANEEESDEEPEADDEEDDEDFNDGFEDDGDADEEDEEEEEEPPAPARSTRARSRASAPAAAKAAPAKKAAPAAARRRRS